MIRRLTLCLLLPLLLLAIGIASKAYFDASFTPNQFQIFYATKLQTALFSSFLSLGGFLFSLKTFIVIKMKESVYDNVEYHSRLEERRKINPAITSYGPLRRLSDLLFYAVVSSLCTALLQFTVGFIPDWPEALSCTYAALFTLLLFLVSLFEIKANLNYWFEFLEKKAAIPQAGGPEK